MSQARWLASNRVILPAPDCPAISRAQVASTPQASGDTMPIPVITTRRIGFPCRKSPPRLPRKPRERQASIAAP